MSATISWLDAWSLWFAGRQVDQDLHMWGLSIRWWSRLGKIVVFVGGATVVLDLYAKDELRYLGRVDAISASFVVLLGAPASVLGWISFFADTAVSNFISFVLFVAPVVAAVLLFSPPFKYSRYVRQLFDREEPGHPLRVIGAVLIFVGFHFDLLSS